MKLTIPLALLASSATTASANDYDNIIRRALLPRQTSSADGGLPGALNIDGDCLDDAIELLQAMPTPSPEFLQAMDQPTEEGCYELPKSLDGEFSSYSSAVSSFLQENEELASSADEACAEATLLPDTEFCEGKGPNDRSAGRGLRVSMGVLVGGVVATLLIL